MNNVPASTTVETSYSEKLLLRVNSLQKKGTLSKPEKTRLSKIKADLINHLASGGAIALCLMFLGGPAIAAERWTPNPDRGSANGTLPGGKR